MKISYASILYQRAMLELGEHCPHVQRLDDTVIRKWGSGINIPSFGQPNEILWREDGPLGWGACSALSISDLMQEIGTFAKASLWFDANPLPSLRNRFPDFEWKIIDWSQTHEPDESGKRDLEKNELFCRIWHFGRYSMTGKHSSGILTEKLIITL